MGVKKYLFLTHLPEPLPCRSWHLPEASGVAASVIEPFSPLALDEPIHHVIS